ncbi:MAG: MATE family efflux transporter [Puniceicoccaceae bacterium]
MQGRGRFWVESWQTLILALPLVVGQLSQMALALADTLMIGRVGVEELAACALANSVLHLPLMLGIGLLIAVSVRVAQARGRKTPEAAATALRIGIFFSLILGILIVGMVALVLPMLPWIGQDEAVLEVIPTYFYYLALSMGPGLMGIALKNFADAMNRPWWPLGILSAGVVLNVFLNWVLIFGNLGSPALGLNGAGLATLISRMVTLAVLALWVFRLTPQFGAWLPKLWWVRFGPGALVNFLKVGVPSAIHLLSEVGAFVLATLMIGSLGAAALSAHQIAITCAGTSFMVPLGLGMALTVRIGEAWGAGEVERLRVIALGGWLMATLFACLSATLFYIYRTEIAWLFIDDFEVVELTVHLLVIAATFQIADGIQITSASGLRGMDDVRTPAGIAVAVYWFLALPLGWVLGLEWGQGAIGVWWGLTVGLTVAAGVLSIRFFLRTRIGHPNRLPERGPAA